MPYENSNEQEYPEPETGLAIRGAIKTGQLGGPMCPPGHWLDWETNGPKFAALAAALAQPGYEFKHVDPPTAATESHSQVRIYTDTVLVREKIRADTPTILLIVGAKPPEQLLEFLREKSLSLAQPCR